MSTQYISSTTTKYGDLERVKEDVNTLREILYRQGSSLLIDVIAETTGETANKYRFTPFHISTVIKSLLNELESSLKERL